MATPAARLPRRSPRPSSRFKVIEGAKRDDAAISNPVTNLGVRGQDPATATVVEPPQRLTQMDLEYAYRGTLLGVVIDALPEECTKAGWDVELGDDGQHEDTEKACARREVELGLLQSLCQAHKWARAFGGGAVVLGIDDGRKMDEPVDLARLKRVLWGVPVHRFQLQPVAWDEDVTSPSFSKPLHYRLGTVIGGRFVPNIALQRIHASRVLPFRGRTVPDDRLAEVDYWGDPETQMLFEDWRALMVANVGAERVLHDWRVLILNLKMGQTLDAAEANGVDDKATMRRLTTIARHESLVNAICLDEGESAELLSSGMDGFAAAYRIFQARFAASSKMAMTRLFGEAPGGLSTDDKSGTRNQRDETARAQRDKYEGNIALAWTYLAAEQGLTGVIPTVEFRDLEPKSDLELADIELKQAQALAARQSAYASAVQWNEVEPSEARDPVFGLDTPKPPDEIPQTQPSLGTSATAPLPATAPTGT